MSTESTRSGLGLCEHLANRIKGGANYDLLSRFPLLAHDVQVMFDLGVIQHRSGETHDEDKAILQQVAAGCLLSGDLIGRMIPHECDHLWRGIVWDADMLGDYLGWGYREGILSDSSNQMC